MTIDTYTIDHYIQTAMTSEDIDLNTSERARNAAAALAVHVMTEAHLPLDTKMEIDENEIDFAFAEIADRFADMRDDLAETVDSIRDDLGIEDVDEEEADLTEVMELPRLRALSEEAAPWEAGAPESEYATAENADALFGITSTEDLTALSDEEIEERAAQERMDHFMDREREF